MEQNRIEQNRIEQNRIGQTGQDRIEQNRIEQNRIEQDMTGQDRTEQNRTEQNRKEQNVIEQNRTDRTGQNRIEQNRIVFWFRVLPGRCTQALKQALCAPYSVLSYRSSVPLAKFQMAPIPRIVMSCGSKNKEPKYICLSEARAALYKYNVDI